MIHQIFKRGLRPPPPASKTKIKKGEVEYPKMAKEDNSQPKGLQPE